MDISDLTPDPTATSYYDRLDVPPDADDKTLSKAGKVALSEFSETETRLLLSVKQARSVLVDPETRNIYDDFIDQFGLETGTRAFEDWEQSSGVSAEEFKSRIESTENDSTEDIEWKNIEISTPSVVRENSDTDKYVEVNLWEGDRLYINEFHDEDIYIDVDTGRIYTQNYQEITDIERELSDDGDVLKLQYSGQTLSIDLSDGGSWGNNMVEVESAIVEWVNKSRLGNGSASFWSRGEVAPRIYLNDVFDFGDVYINTQNGLVYSQDDNAVIQSATCNLNSKGDEIHLSYNDATIKISLITPTQPSSSIPTPTSDDSSTKDKHDTHENETNERNKRKESHDNGGPDEFDDAYDGKEFGYDPDGEDSSRDRHRDINEGYTQDNTEEESSDESKNNINTSFTFSVYNGDSKIIQLLLYPILAYIYPGVYTASKLKWRWQFVFGIIFLFGLAELQSSMSLDLWSSVLDIVFIVIGPSFFAFTIPGFPIAALEMDGRTTLVRAVIGLYPLVYWFIVTLFIDRFS